MSVRPCNDFDFRPKTSEQQSNNLGEIRSRGWNLGAKIHQFVVSGGEHDDFHCLNRHFRLLGVLFGGNTVHLRRLPLGMGTMRKGYFGTREDFECEN